MGVLSLAPARQKHFHCNGYIEWAFSCEKRYGTFDLLPGNSRNLKVSFPH